MRSLLFASLLSLAALAPAQTLTTTMAGATTLVPYTGAQTLYFDVNVTNPNGIFVSQIDIRCVVGLGSLPGTLDVYRTAVGSTQASLRNSPSSWRRVGTATIAAVGVPATGVLSQPFYLAPGTYGIGLHCIVIQPQYFNPGTTGQLIYSNADVAIDCTAGVAQNSTATAPIGGGVSAAPRVAQISLTYTLAGHTTDFTVSPAAGNAPLSFAGVSPQNLIFTDESHTSDPGGLLPLWDWDFDGDNVTDQTTNVPTAAFNYTSCGTFNVSVTSYDALGPVTKTKVGFVAMDPLTGGFTFAKIGDPAVFQFTDTSSGATGWQWNLDGVPGIDSTAQNPVFAYAAGCAPVTVTQTVTNACRNTSVTRTLVPEPSIETLIVGTNNAGNAGGAVYFDVNVTNPDGVQICGFGLNMNEAVGGTPMQATFWEKAGTSVGSENVAGAWTNRGAVFTNASRRDTETLVTLPAPVYLAPGLHGFAIQCTGVGQAYSGTGTSPAPANTSYSNADLTLTLGTSLNVAFTGAPFSPRIWSGRINYRTVAQNMSGYYKFASGCAGTAGVPGNVAVALPTIGQNLQVNFPNVPFGALVFYGFSNTLLNGTIPLPVDAGPLGAPGCPVLISPDVTGPLLLSPNPTWTEFVPVLPSLLGAHFYTQAFSFELPGFNTLGGSLSDGATGVIGG